MKQQTLLIAVFFALAFASCKKDWTCVCNTNTGTKNSNTIYIEQVNKKTAKDRCKLHDKTYQNGSVTVIETCELQ